MAVEGVSSKLSVSAGADLSARQYQLISVAGTMAATAHAAIGVLQNKPLSGEDATLAFAGHMKALAGGTITAGNTLSCTASGTLYSVSSAWGLGTAVTACVSGGIVEFVGDFTNT